MKNNRIIRLILTILISAYLLIAIGVASSAGSSNSVQTDPGGIKPAMGEFSEPIPVKIVPESALRLIDPPE